MTLVCRGLDRDQTKVILLSCQKQPGKVIFTILILVSLYEFKPHTKNYLNFLATSSSSLQLQ